jgi:hypothetical protein
MDFDEVVKRRKMIRDYDLEKQIPNELITKLIKNARSGIYNSKGCFNKKEIKKGSCKSRICRKCSSINCSVF